MGLIEKAKLWRRMGRVLNTSAGASVVEGTRGLVNRAAGMLMTPDLTDDIPFTPVDRPLCDSSVAVISTAGLYRQGDEPFDVDAADGDPSFREIPADVDLGELRIAHAHYTHRYADRDPNVLLPLDRLRELAAAGVLRLAPRAFSFGFGGTLTRAYIEPPDGTAHALARALQSDEVDLALLVPA